MILTLLPDERVPLRLIWDASDAEEIRSIGPIARRFEIVGSGGSGASTITAMSTT